MISHPSHQPSLTATVLAPLARVWQKTQDGVAKLLGLKNANTASATVGVIGATGMAVSNILGPLGPVVYGAGWGLLVAGALGLVENHVTKKVGNWDGKGKA